MNKYFGMGILAITLCTFAACDTAHKKQMPNGENTVSTDINGKALSLEVEWIKNKRKSLDMSLVLRNGYEQWVTYKKRSWNLTFNGRPSEVQAVLKKESSSSRSKATSKNMDMAFSRLTRSVQAVMQAGNKKYQLLL